MAKDLPYFKFFCSEWNDGDITLEDYKTQGVFINVCSYYWSNECDVTEKNLRKKFKNELEIIDYLINEGLLKQCDDDTICISFLDEQIKDRGNLSKQNSQNALKMWEKKRAQSEKDASALKPHNENNAIEIREDKIREDKSITPDESADKYQKFIGWFNSELKTNYRGDKKSRAAFNARIKEGYTGENFGKALAAMKADEHHKENGYKWITPEFITRVDKLEKFVNADSTPKHTPLDYNKFLQ